jgi:2-keto-3-deoxy-L-rhamnonate aldolase RhmA
MHNMVSATAGTGASPVVRVRAGSADLIKRALDTGAQ